MRVYITAVVFAAVFFLFHFDLLKRFELVTYDYRQMIKGPRTTDPRIVVIEISDDSISKIGRWPWDRDWHATLVKILSDQGAEAVVFDVLFSEPSDPVKDAALSQAIYKAKNVYLAEVIDSASKNQPLLTSLPEFVNGAKGQGHINLQPDVDGVMRRIPLMIEVNGKQIPQLSLAVALDEYGARSENVLIKDRELRIPIKKGKFLSVPLDKQGNMLINWAGKWSTAFKHYSYIDVVTSYVTAQNGGKPLIPMDSFKGKICFIGTTALGLFDIRPTPLEPSYPAVGVNLNILQNLIDQKFIRILSYWQNLLILLAMILILIRIMKIQGHFKSAILAGGLILAYFFTTLALFVFFNLWVSLIYPLLLVSGAYFFVTIYNQLSVTIEKAQLFKLATRDSLTGLFNIGHFKLLLKAEIMTTSLRRERKLSILMGDVDNFKKTNDTYGHVMGDTVLKEVAKAVQGNCRALDVAARYGGEEFILMLPGANEEEAYKVADKIRAAINAKVFFHEKGDFQTSISIGVTRVSPDDEDLEALVARADRALYEAKHTGKNKVMIAKDSPRFDEKGNLLPPGDSTPSRERSQLL